MEGLENELWRRWSDGKFGEWALLYISISMSSAHSPTFTVTSPTSQLILQTFRRFTYVTAHSPTLQLLHLCHSSFSNPSFASPTSQERAELILQPFRHFTYVTAHSPTLPSLYLHHSSFSNPSVASPTSQALHLIHLASHPCWLDVNDSDISRDETEKWNVYFQETGYGLGLGWVSIYYPCKHGPWGWDEWITTHKREGGNTCRIKTSACTGPYDHLVTTHHFLKFI